MLDTDRHHCQNRAGIGKNLYPSLSVHHGAADAAMAVVECSIRIFTSVTSIDNLEALKTAWGLYSNEAANPDSLLSRVAKGDPAYGERAGQLARLYEDTNVQVETILAKRSLLLPDVRNRIRNSAITELAKKAYEQHNDNLYAVRAVLFLNVSRLRSPAPDEIYFSARQARKIKTLLEPGNTVLTFKSG